MTKQWGQKAWATAAVMVAAALAGCQSTGGVKPTAVVAKKKADDNGVRQAAFVPEAPKRPGSSC